MPREFGDHGRFVSRGPGLRVLLMPVAMGGLKFVRLWGAAGQNQAFASRREVAET
jgi:hypothetical protein